MYVVEAIEILRGKPRQTHSYVVGIFTEKHNAAVAAIAEEYWRGGKYECIISEYSPNCVEPEKITSLIGEYLSEDELAEEVKKRL